MQEILKKEVINTERQENLDSLKTIAIISMTIAHAVMMLARHRPGFETDFAYLFGRYLLADYFAVAHGFMFAMGVGITYSRNNEPKDLISRGIKIYLTGYVLNFFRYGIYSLVESIWLGRITNSLINSLVEQDILQFAGLAMIVTGLFKHFKVDVKGIMVIGMLLSVIGSFISCFDTGNYLLNLLMAHFVYTTDDISGFGFFHWYCFVAFGILFGYVIRRVENQDLFYKKLMVVSGGISIIYIALSVKYGAFFLSKNHHYYSLSTPEAVGLISLDLFALSVLYFVVHRAKRKNLNFCLTVSKNVNEIYIIHWIILGFIDCVFCYVFGVVMSYPVIYAIGVLLVFVSLLIAIRVKKPKL